MFKRFVWLGVATVVLVMAAQADAARGDRERRKDAAAQDQARTEQQVKAQLAELARELNLTDDQRTQIRHILVEGIKEADPIVRQARLDVRQARAKAEDKAAAREQVRKIRADARDELKKIAEKTDKRIDAVLTDEQKAKFKEIVQKKATEKRTEPALHEEDDESADEEEADEAPEAGATETKPAAK
jgi:Spy/CpxP family protein refolding chaperone